MSVDNNSLSLKQCIYPNNAVRIDKRIFLKSNIIYILNILLTAS